MNSQRGKYEGEIRAQRMQLVANEERIAALMAQLSGADEQLGAPCKSCANYEYQLVKLQDRIQAGKDEHEAACQRFERERAAAQTRLDEQAVRHAKHLKATLDEHEVRDGEVGGGSKSCVLLQAA